MKINVGQKIKLLSGEDLTNEKKEPMLLKDVGVLSLVSNHESDQGVTGEEKFRRYLLAEKLENAVKAPNSGEVELTVEEVAKLKDRVGKIFGAAVVGPVYKMFEG